MAKKKQRRIFLRDGEQLYQFMWADLKTDGSVVLGLSCVTKGEISGVFAPSQGRLSGEDLHQAEGDVAAKFTFHSSGIYKGEGCIGIDPSARDRPTIDGPPLSEILEPQRMLEILLPKMLCRAEHDPREDDLVLSFNSNPLASLRCAITCMAISKYQAIHWESIRILENSIWETHDALASDTNAWVWTIGQCRRDCSIPPDFLVALLGSNRWGRTIDERVV